tara:strand:- start:1084 stop:1293 length:210 start_codon:yes stop_codon:yes gene_type:complete
MKKSSQDIKLSNADISTNNDFDINRVKTTNVNILLNRVRLDKKKSFRKKIFFLSMSVTIVSTIVIFLII